MSMPDQDILHAISLYDLDNSGTIEELEFVEFLNAYIRASLKKSSMKAKKTADKYALRDVATGQVWQVPQDGILEIDFIYDREATLDAMDATHGNKLSRSMDFSTLFRFLSYIIATHFQGTKSLRSAIFIDTCQVSSLCLIGIIELYDAFTRPKNIYTYDQSGDANFPRSYIYIYIYNEEAEAENMAASSTSCATCM
jgi:hypothetical protein